MRAARLRFDQVPNPAIDTWSSDVTPSLIAWSTMFTVSSAADLVVSSSAQTASINSRLFMIIRVFGSWRDVISEELPALVN